MRVYKYRFDDGTWAKTGFVRTTEAKAKVWYVLGHIKSALRNSLPYSAKKQSDLDECKGKIICYELKQSSEIIPTLTLKKDSYGYRNIEIDYNESNLEDFKSEKEEDEEI